MGWDEIKWDEARRDIVNMAHRVEEASCDLAHVEARQLERLAEVAPPPWCRIRSRAPASLAVWATGLG